MSIFKNVWAVVLGCISAMVLISLGEYVMELFYPFPKNLNFRKSADVIHFLSNLPTSAFLFLLVNYMVSSFTGGIVATLFSKRTTMSPPAVVGVLLTAVGIFNNIQVPHPMWFAVLNLLIYFPMAYLGYNVARNRTQPTNFEQAKLS